jgi:hypothetical protein
VGEKSDYDVEFRILLPGGTVKYIHAVGHPVLNASGDLVEFAGSSTDITERKQSEEALRRSEGYLAEAQRLTRTGSWAWNVATRQSVYWSQENYRLFGFDPEGDVPSDEAFYQRAFIQRIEIGCAEKFFLKGRTKAPTLTWISESFFQTGQLSTFARQVIPFATYPAISLNTSVHR